MTHDARTRSEGWRYDGVCVDQPSELWDGETSADRESARSICAICPVRTPCREDALIEERGNGPDYRWGIRAGLTGRERHALDRLRARGASAGERA